MSSQQVTLPSGVEFVRYRNPVTGAILYIPAPAGFQLDTTAGPSNPGAATDVPVSSTTPAAAHVSVPSTTPGTAPAVTAATMPHHTAAGTSTTLVAPPVSASSTTPGTANVSVSSTTPGTVMDVPTSSTTPAAADVYASSTTPGTVMAVTSATTPGPSSHADDSSNYAPTDGPLSSRHIESAMDESNLVKMERYFASCANSEVYRLVFRASNVIAKMSSRENVTFPAGVTHLADFLASGKAARHLVLHFATSRRDVINVDPRLWAAFTADTSLVAISGTLHHEELGRLLPALKNVNTLNICNQRFLRTGSLVDFCRFIPSNVVHLVFDTRYTSNSTLVENVTALYADIFMRQRLSKPCFKSILLVVEDFCQRKCFAAQVLRLSQMLLDETSYATILTSTPGDDTILRILLSLDFKRADPAYYSNIDRCYQQYDYWTTAVFGKSVTIGFLVSTVAPIPENNGVLF